MARSENVDEGDGSCIGCPFGGERRAHARMRGVRAIHQSVPPVRSRAAPPPKAEIYRGAPVIRDPKSTALTLTEQAGKHLQRVLAEAPS